MQEEMDEDNRNETMEEKVCLVCNRTETGYRYVALTICNSCKNFFHRTANKKLNWKCNNNDECQSTGRIRKCRKCRLDKCLAAGLKPRENFLQEQFGKIRNQKVCLVCTDAAQCRRNGLYTCSSCQSFFRQAKHRKEMQCLKNDDKCRMNFFSERRCEKCRLSKCFAVGMRLDIVGKEKRRGRGRQRVEEHVSMQQEVIDTEVNFNKDPVHHDSHAFFLDPTLLTPSSRLMPPPPLSSSPIYHLPLKPSQAYPIYVLSQSPYDMSQIGMKGSWLASQQFEPQDPGIIESMMSVNQHDVEWNSREYRPFMEASSTMMSSPAPPPYSL